MLNWFAIGKKLTASTSLASKSWFKLIILLMTENYGIPMKHNRKLTVKLEELTQPDQAML